MKSNILFKERGQALVVVALAAVVLFGFMALAIDGTAKLSDRRHAQNAADTAAVAAALAKVNALTAGGTDTVCPPVSGLPSPVCADTINAGSARAISNGYGADITTSTVEIYSPPISGYYSTVSNKSSYVQVIITSHVKTNFMRVLGIQQSDNVVQAVAFTKQGGKLFDGASIVSLNPDTSSGCSGTLRIGGGATIHLSGGGMFLNSDASNCAMEQQGGCSGVTDLLIIDSPGGILSAGHDNVDFDSCTTNVPPIAYDQIQKVIPDDIYLPDVPIECDGSHPGGFSNTGSKSYLRPGKYTTFPPTGHGIKNDLVMNAGTYCIDGNIHWTSGTFNTLVGNGVTLFITKGHDFTIDGSNITLEAPDSGDYAGYVFIVDTDFSGTQGACTINGNSHNLFSGTIYAPYCDVSLSGSNESGTPDVQYSTQVIGWNVQITGNSKVDFIYDPADQGKAKRQVGLMK